jgi:hypothetical protein
MWRQMPGSHHSLFAVTPTSMAFVPRDDFSYAMCQVYSLIGRVVKETAGLNDID